MEMEKLKYPIGIQSFRVIIEGGFVYVDKTSYIPMLENGKFYFLGRPGSVPGSGRSGPSSISTLTANDMVRRAW